VTERKQFISGLSWNTLTVVFQILIQTVYTGLLARMISPDSFALMGVVLSIMGFAEIFSQVGIGPAIIQRKDLHPQHLTGAFYTSLILGVSFTLVFVVTAPFFASSYHLPELEPIMQVVSTSFTISALAVVPRSLTLKEMRFKSFFMAGMISIVGGNLIIGLLLAYLGYGVWAYVWALFAQNALMTLAYWALQPTRFPLKWQWAPTKELIGYGASSTVFNALNYAATKVDVTILPKYVNELPASTGSTPLQSAGIYERSAYVMSLPITIMAKLSDNVLFSGMSKMQEETERLRRLIAVATQMLGLVVIPLVVFAACFSNEIIAIYLGSKFIEAVPILQILMFAVIFRTLSRLADSLVRARNAVVKASWYKAFYLVIMIMGVYFTIPYGTRWIAVSILFTTFVHYLMSIHLAHILIGSSWKVQLAATKPGLILGAITLLIGTPFMMDWIFVEMAALLRLMVGASLWAAALALVVYKLPHWLIVNNNNPLDLIPIGIRNRLKL
jgi:O-antigen/teichoic acid export membrane protein